MKIKYNAPTVLTYSIFSAIVLMLSLYLLPNLNKALFMVPGRSAFSFGSPLDWFRLFSHVAGHADWTHLISNFALILLIGPILEELYGSLSMLLMIAITALVTGLLNALFFSSGLMGASGVAFMMVLLISFTNFKRGEIPLTFLLILVLYLGRELLNAIVAPDNGISEFAHVAGGFCGSLFGFFRPTKKVLVE